MMYLWILFFCTSCFATDESSFFKNVFEHQFQSKENFTEKNKKLIVMYSAVPGMGKTTISTILSSMLKGIIISADQCREELRRALQYYGNDHEIKLEKYIDYCLKKVLDKSKNGFIILDRSIDGIENEMLALAEKYQFELYLIRLHLSRDKVIERLKKREIDPSLHLVRLKRLDQWFKEYENSPIECFNFHLNMEDSYLEKESKNLIKDLCLRMNKITCI